MRADMGEVKGCNSVGKEDCDGESVAGGTCGKCARRHCASAEKKACEIQVQELQLVCVCGWGGQRRESCTGRAA